jgi:hypothetical protein
MWQNTDSRTDAEYDEWLAEVGRAEAERDMEPHKRDGYAERMYEMTDMRSKEIMESRP